jgi:outer membrane lipoprotein-sorting protein
MRKLVCALAVALAMVVAMVLPAAAASEKEILSRMDAAAPGFKGMTADITRVKFTSILNDRSEEIGTMSILRSGKSLRAKIVIEKPNARAVSFEGEQVEVFYPKINTVQVFDIGKNRGLIDQFLLLGFGGSGKDLSRSYQVKAMGQEKVNGVSATRLVLTPKTAKVRESIKSVEIWVPDGEAYPIRQKFVEPSDDFTEVTYRGIKVNPGLTPAHLKLELPAGVKREYPQK